MPWEKDQYGNWIETGDESKPPQQSQQSPAPPLSFQDRMDYMDAGITREVSPEENASANSRMRSGVSGAVQGGIQGGVPGALLGGGLGVALPNEAHATKIGQSAGARLALDAFLGKYKHLGRFAQGGAAAVGDFVGGALGDAADQALGNEQESLGGRLFSSGAAGLGQAISPRKPEMVGPELKPSRIDFPEEGRGAYLNYAQDDDAFSTGLRSLMRGSNEYIDDSMNGFRDAWVATTGTPMSSQETVDFMTALHKSVIRSGGKGDPGVLEKVADIAGDNQATMRTVFNTLFPKNGGKFADPQAAATALATVKQNLRGNPELYEKFVSTWVTRNLLEESLTVGKGEMAERGANFFADVAPAGGTTRNAATGRISSELVLGDDPTAKTLNGAKLLTRLEGLQGVLEQGLGKKKYQSLVNMAKAMNLIDPENTGGVRQKLTNLVMPSMRYNANRMMFYGTQAAVMGAGGMGLAAATGASMAAGLGLGLGATAAGISLDKMALIAMKNPEAIQGFVDAVKKGNTGVATTLWRSLIRSSEQPLLDTENQVRPAPVAGGNQPYAF